MLTSEYSSGLVLATAFTFWGGDASFDARWQHELGALRTLLMNQDFFQKSSLSGLLLGSPYLAAGARTRITLARCGHILCCAELCDDRAHVENGSPSRSVFAREHPKCALGAGCGSSSSERGRRSPWSPALGRTSGRGPSPLHPSGPSCIVGSRAVNRLSLRPDCSNATCVAAVNVELGLGRCEGRGRHLRVRTGGGDNQLCSLDCNRSISRYSLPLVCTACCITVPMFAITQVPLSPWAGVGAGLPASAW